MKNAERFALWVLVILSLIGPPIGMRAQNLFNRNDGTFAQVDAASVMGGTPVLLTTFNASNSASFSDTTDITTKYSAYLVTMSSVEPVANATQLVLRVHSGGSFQSTSYFNATLVGNSAASASNGSADSGVTLTSRGAVDVANNVGYGVFGSFILYGPVNDGLTKAVVGQAGYLNTTPAAQVVNFFGFWNSGADIDGIQIFFGGSTNINVGQIKLYGLQ